MLTQPVRYCLSRDSTYHGHSEIQGDGADISFCVPIIIVVSPAERVKASAWK